jgi:hypothetical protein
METTRLDQIRKRIERIKTELVAIDEMRPGSLTEQLKKPDAQRGYYQLSIRTAVRVEPNTSLAMVCARFGVRSSTTSGSKH